MSSARRSDTANTQHDRRQGLSHCAFELLVVRLQMPPGSYDEMFASARSAIADGEVENWVTEFNNADGGVIEVTLDHHHLYPWLWHFEVGRSLKQTPPELTSMVVIGGRL